VAFFTTDRPSLAEALHADTRLKGTRAAATTGVNRAAVAGPVHLEGGVAHINGGWTRGRDDKTKKQKSAAENAAERQQDSASAAMPPLEPAVMALVTSFADFFLLGRCNAAFLTANSLFGKVATERGLEPGGTCTRKYMINDSQCDQPGHKPCRKAIEQDRSKGALPLPLKGASSGGCLANLQEVVRGRPDWA
jgi:hypothetical protein